MFHQFKDYFQFSKAERAGVIILVILIIALITTKQLLVHFTPEISYQIQTFDSLSVQLDRLEDLEKKRQKINAEESQSFELKDFNPNTFSASDWEEFGLSRKQAQVIKNYQAKAGDFESKKDVKKLFVISDELYQKLEPHILLPDSVIKKSEKKRFNSFTKMSREHRPLPKVLINTADTTEFKQLRGIGKVLSARIVKYRTELGGFHNKNQLQEVWGLSQEVLLKLDTQLIYDTIELRRINVNRSSEEELKAHPYIRWKVANSIVKYRKQHGDYLKLTDLKKSVLITDSIYQRISPYLEL